MRDLSVAQPDEPINPIDISAGALHRWYWGKCERTGLPGYHWTYPHIEPATLSNYISFHSPEDVARWQRILS